MQESARDLPEFSVVSQMPGVGAVLAPRLIAEIGDIRRFRSASAHVAFAGIDALPFPTGTFTATKRSISERGSPLLRKSGYERMQSLKRLKPEECPAFSYICKKEAEGKKAAKSAGLNKLLRIFCACVKEIYALLEPALRFQDSLSPIQGWRLANFFCFPIDFVEQVYDAGVPACIGSCSPSWTCHTPVNRPALSGQSFRTLASPRGHGHSWCSRNKRRCLAES